jgi:hypothetical protein
MVQQEKPAWISPLLIKLITQAFLHLPRFLAKIKKHLLGNLPTSYQRNFTKGFDGFLCLHLGLEPDQIIECVKSSESEEELEIKLAKIFPQI